MNGCRVLLAAAGLIAAWASPALARLNGVVAGSCTSCHGENRVLPVAITIDRPLVDLGATVTVTVRIAASAVGGFYLTTYNVGTFKDIPGQGTRLATPIDVVHAAPKPASGGQVTFQVSWTAPTTMGTVDFEAFAVAANGDGTANGDTGGRGRLSVAVGCPGVERFVDVDKDGWGAMDDVPKENVCEGTPGFTDKAGDCNDYLAYVHPMAPERCNGLDDDCNGQADEGLDTVTVYRDADGDGYGQRFSTDTHTGCNTSGYAPNQDDCDDRDKAVHPGAKEICNNLDDDCNGRFDEGARATCGLGWCERYAEACDARTCFPGKPRVEECNLYDDDCDGVIDNGAKCEAGKVCFGGRCLVSDDAKAAAEAQNAMASDGGVPGDRPDSSAPSGTAATRPPLHTASACAHGGAGGPAWPALFVVLAAIVRSARGAGARPRRRRRSERRR